MDLEVVRNERLLPMAENRVLSVSVTGTATTHKAKVSDEDGPGRDIPACCRHVVVVATDWCVLKRRHADDK